MTRFDEQFCQFARPVQEHFFGEENDVTYTSRASGTTATISQAIRGPVSQPDQQLGAQSTRTITMTWSIRKSDLDAESITPKRGDTITDSDGEVWSVLSWNQTGIQTIYDFVCQKGTA